MFRQAIVVVALAAGVVQAQPKNTRSVTTKAKSAKSADAKSAKSTTSKSKSKKTKKAEAKVPWLPTRSTLAKMEGMPPGFTWPPTRAMEAREHECESKLDRAGVQWERGTAEGRVVNPILVPAMTFGGVRYVNMWGSKAPHVLDCQLALALETIGPELRAIGVREVRYGSIFRWSHVRSHGVTRPLLSRHALGLAMDIGSFVDENGREAVVKQHYNAGDPLLLSIEQLVNANGNFRIVLTPKNDPISHSDHFHIEARAEYTSPDVP